MNPKIYKSQNITLHEIPYITILTFYFTSQIYKMYVNFTANLPSWGYFCTTFL